MIDDPSPLDPSPLDPSPLDPAHTDPAHTDLALLDAVTLTRRYAAGTLSPVEVLDAVLARVEALEPSLHAFYVSDPDAARAAAREAEARWRSGAPAGPIDGVPITLKENIATAGTPVPVGSAITPLVPAPDDAPAAARVREAGGVLIGKTTMPDLGMLTTGLSSLHATARNPWDLARTPGGSSAGAAAAAAAGYGPLHVGTDIGGSVRLPAAWCGLVGVKPSFGRVPVDPPYLGRHIGPLTRTVADAALLLSVLARPDRRDHLGLPPVTLDWASAIDPVDVEGLRVGVLLDAGVGLPVDPEIAAVVKATAQGLAARGAVVEPVAPVLTRAMLDGLDTFWRARAWAQLRDLENRDDALPIIVAWAAGAERFSGVEVYRGYAQLDAIARATLDATEPYDVVLSPTCPVGPPPAGSASPTDDPDRAFEHIAFTVPFNMSGQPAVSVDAGSHADGMPIGVQISGRRFDDLGVLRVAADHERHHPPRRPPLP